MISQIPAQAVARPVGEGVNAGIVGREVTNRRGTTGGERDGEDDAHASLVKQTAC